MAQISAWASASLGKSDIQQHWICYAKLYLIPGLGYFLPSNIYIFRGFPFHITVYILFFKYDPGLLMLLVVHRNWESFSHFQTLRTFSIHLTQWTDKRNFFSRSTIAPLVFQLKSPIKFSPIKSPIKISRPYPGLK